MLYGHVTQEHNNLCLPIREMTITLDDGLTLLLGMSKKLVPAGICG